MGFHIKAARIERTGNLVDFQHLLGHGGVHDQLTNCMHHPHRKGKIGIDLFLMRQPLGYHGRMHAVMPELFKVKSGNILKAAGQSGTHHQGAHCHKSEH